MQTREQFLEQCLIDELNNRPKLAQMERQTMFAFGMLVGWVLGALGMWVLMR